MKPNEIVLTREDILCSKIGAALISAQRVEFATEKIIGFLTENGNDFKGIITDEFMNASEQAKKKNYLMLGDIFRLLKLNSKLVIDDELTKYKDMRNTLVHDFYKIYLQPKSDEKMQNAMMFCYAFGRFSNRLEKFFNGFLYFLSLRYVKDMYHLPDSIQKLRNDFEYFWVSLQYEKLQEIEGQSIDDNFINSLSKK